MLEVHTAGKQRFLKLMWIRGKIFSPSLGRAQLLRQVSLANFKKIKINKYIYIMYTKRMYGY